MDKRHGRNRRQTHANTTSLFLTMHARNQRESYTIRTSAVLKRENSARIHRCYTRRDCPKSTARRRNYTLCIRAATSFAVNCLTALSLAVCIPTITRQIWPLCANGVLYKIKRKERTRNLWLPQRTRMARRIVMNARSGRRTYTQTRGARRRTRGARNIRTRNNDRARLDREPQLRRSRIVTQIQLLHNVRFEHW